MSVGLGDPDARESGGPCGLDTPSRVFDRDAGGRRPFVKRRGPKVRIRRGLARRRIARRHDEAETVPQAGLAQDAFDLVPQGA